MSNDKLVDAIGLLGDDLIREAKQSRTKSHWQRISAAAVCLVLLIGVVLLLLMRPAGADTPVAVQINGQVPEQGYLGNYGAFSGNGSSLELNWHGVAVTAKAVKMLPDTYLFIGDSRKTPLRLVHMKTLKTLHGENMVEEFYFLLPEIFATDLTKFDALILDNLCQYGYEKHILFNQTDGCYEAPALVLFGTYQSFYPYNGIYAFSNSIFDETLWSSNAAWSKNFESQIKQLDTPSNHDIVRREWTLLQSEVKVEQRYTNCSYQPSVGTLTSVSTMAEEQALDHIKPFQNGIFIREPSWISISGNSVFGTFRRYINGYPTNETVAFLSNDVRYSSETFSEEDLAQLPNLASALSAVANAFNAEQIMPPHIIDWQNRNLMDYAVIGWYTKTATGVYGIVRVDWKFQGEEFWDSYYDDCYFIISSGQSEVQPISRDDLLTILELETVFVYTGEYGSLGKAKPLRPFSPSK